jgi:hypothetical protein
MAEKHDGRGHLAAKVSRYLSVGVGVVLIQKTVFGSIDIVSPAGDSLLSRAARFAAHQEDTQVLAQFVSKLPPHPKELESDWCQFPFGDLTANEDALMISH